MAAHPGDGTVAGAVRAALDLTKLQPFLERNVKGFAGPIGVKQFGVGVICLFF